MCPKKRNQITASWQMSDGLARLFLLSPRASGQLLGNYLAATGNYWQLWTFSSALFGLLTESDPE